MYHFHVDVLPRLILQSQAQLMPQSEIGDWEFVTIITLTSIANTIP